jgi:peptidoglycan/LPS O-acetylase OafA/YrhL
MNKQTSIYLDCARFLAAFTVMLCHIDEFMVKGITPFADHLGIEAVGVFFVLSGFVIGYATESREKDLRTYVINRAARLYSVVIPCLTATLILDTIGHQFMRASYYRPEPFLREAMHIIFSFSFLNYAWILPHAIPPGGGDGPFWSLCYEVPYYAMFGAIWFLRGFKRLLVPAILVGIMGPDLFWLFPIWLAGLGLYHCFRVVELKPFAGRCILLASILLWLGFEALLKYFDLCPDVNADIQAGPILMYGGGSCFALSLVGFRFSAISLDRIAAPVRWLAGATFTLYLLHFPLAWLLNSAMHASPIGDWPAILRWVLLAAVTFGLVLAVAQVTERRKQDWRRGIEYIFSVAERVIGAPGRLRSKKARQSLL